MWLQWNIFLHLLIFPQPASHLYHTSHLMEIPELLAEARLPLSGSLKFQPIQPHFSSLLCSSWKFSSDATVQIVSTLANLGRVLGIFSQGETEPIAWMVIFRWNKQNIICNVKQVVLVTTSRECWGREKILEKKEWPDFYWRKQQRKCLILVWSLASTSRMTILPHKHSLEKMDLSVPSWPSGWLTNLQEQTEILMIYEEKTRGCI